MLKKKARQGADCGNAARAGKATKKTCGVKPKHKQPKLADDSAEGESDGSWRGGAQAEKGDVVSVLGDSQGWLTGSLLLAMQHSGA